MRVLLKTCSWPGVYVTFSDSRPQAVSSYPRGIGRPIVVWWMVVKRVDLANPFRDIVGERHRGWIDALSENEREPTRKAAGSRVDQRLGCQALDLTGNSF